MVSRFSCHEMRPLASFVMIPFCLIGRKFALGMLVTVAICRPDNKQNCYRLGKNVNVKSSALEEVFH